MKVLFIPLQCEHDYQQDTLSWGLRHLHLRGEIELERTYHNRRLYKPYDPTWSHCTYYGKWEGPIPNANLFEINEKILNKYYDLIVWMNADLGNDERFDRTYNLYQNRLFVVDGDDALDKPYMEKLKNYPNLRYFRRSMCHLIKNGHNHLYPIDFGFPDELIDDGPFEKTKLVSSIIPGDGTTYILPESKYYAEYRQSMYAYTYSKCGWSCLRHLEIMFNRCVPIFIDLEFCPNYVMHFFPKLLFGRVMMEHVKMDYKSVDMDLYTAVGKNAYWISFLKSEMIKVKDTPNHSEIEKEIYNHCKKYLTCSAMVNYMLNYYD